MNKQIAEERIISISHLKWIKNEAINDKIEPTVEITTEIAPIIIISSINIESVLVRLPIFVLSILIFSAYN